MSEYGRPIYSNSSTSLSRSSTDRQLLGQVPESSRTDVAAAVASAYKASSSWGKRAAFDRAQPLFRIAEYLSAKSSDFASKLQLSTGRSLVECALEVEKSVDRLFYYAAYADKYGGQVKETQMQAIVYSVNEPTGVVATICDDEYPLLGLISLVAPAIARGNAVVAVPSTVAPLCAIDLYYALDAAELPAGVLNIVTGDRDMMARYLIDEQDVGAVWYHGSAEGSRCVEYYCADSMKRSWVNYGLRYDWMDDKVGRGVEYLRRCTEVKHIWVPYGDGQP